MYWVWPCYKKLKMSIIPWPVPTKSHLCGGKYWIFPPPCPDSPMHSLPVWQSHSKTTASITIISHILVKVTRSERARERRETGSRNPDKLCWAWKDSVSRPLYSHKPSHTKGKNLRTNQEAAIHCSVGWNPTQNTPLSFSDYKKVIVIANV